MHAPISWPRKKKLKWRDLAGHGQQQIQTIGPVKKKRDQAS
jgi:hypothetical protein